MTNPIWLAADFHFPSTYSIRVPGTSMSSAQAMPAPGPATVRLALITVSIELYGEGFTRDRLFPTIRSMPVLIQPPDSVSFSDQVLRAYKGSENENGQTVLQESIIYRQTAHAIGNMTIYCKIDKSMGDIFSQLFFAIGYWGQVDSFTTCIRVSKSSPIPGLYAVPLLKLLDSELSGKYPFFHCFCTEFREATIEWNEFLPGHAFGKKIQEPVKPEVYVWPMEICDQRWGNIHLQRRSLKETRAPPDIGRKVAV